MKPEATLADLHRSPDGTDACSLATLVLMSVMGTPGPRTSTIVNSEWMRCARAGLTSRALPRGGYVIIAFAREPGVSSLEVMLELLREQPAAVSRPRVGVIAGRAVVRGVLWPEHWVSR
jgi:hypothetical protein